MDEYSLQRVVAIRLVEKLTIFVQPLMNSLSIYVKPNHSALFERRIKARYADPDFCIQRSKSDCYIGLIVSNFFQLTVHNVLHSYLETKIFLRIFSGVLSLVLSRDRLLGKYQWNNKLGENIKLQRYEYIMANSRDCLWHCLKETMGKRITELRISASHDLDSSVYELMQGTTIEKLVIHNDILPDSDMWVMFMML